MIGRPTVTGSCHLPGFCLTTRESQADGPDRHGWILLSGKAWGPAISAVPRIQDCPLVT
jgi:hypothetical protein